MLMKSQIYFKSKLGFSLLKRGSARLTFGNHPRAQALKDLRIGRNPLFTGFFPAVTGILDDHVDSWFLSYENPPQEAPDGIESIVDLSLSQERVTAPPASIRPS